MRKKESKISLMVVGNTEIESTADISFTKNDFEYNSDIKFTTLEYQGPDAYQEPEIKRSKISTIYDLYITAENRTIRIIEPENYFIYGEQIKNLVGDICTFTDLGISRKVTNSVKKIINDYRFMSYIISHNFKDDSYEIIIKLNIMEKFLDSKIINIEVIYDIIYDFAVVKYLTE